MGLITNLATGLLATRAHSDIEFKLQAVSERRLAVMDKSKDMSSIYSTCLMTPGNQDDIFCEIKLRELQVLDKELQKQKEQLETQLRIYKEMKEDQLKGAKEGAKKEFTI